MSKKSAPVEIRVHLHNQTTGSSVNASDSVQLLDLQAQGFTLSVPKYTCAVGHVVEIELHITHLSENPFDIHVLGTVKNLEKSSDGRERIEIGLKNPQEKNWLDLQQLFANRQNAVREFFEKLKGY